MRSEYECEQHRWAGEIPCPDCWNELVYDNSKSSGSVPVPSSDTLIEMYLELKDPAKWAAQQIATKSYGIETVGEAMDMIEAIVRAAIEMAHND